jgi:hypothetical protein
VQELLIKPLVSLPSAVPFIGAAILAASMMPNLLGTTLVPEAAPPPISQTDWPIPQRIAPQTLSWVQTRPEYYEDEVPAHQTDWPLPQRLAPHTLAWLQARPEYYQDEIPAHQTDWPTPLRLSSLHVSIDTLFDNTTSADAPFRQSEWATLGRLPRALPAKFAPNLLGTTLAPTAAPFAQTDWTNPAPTRQPAATWLQTRPIFAEDARLIGATETDLPAPARIPALTWLQTRPIFAVDARLVGATATDLPAPARIPALTWLQTRPIFAVDAALPFLINPALPQARPLPALTWTQNLLQSTLTPAAAAPMVPPAWPVPGRPVVAAVTWIQTRPVFAVDDRLVGATETDLPAPSRAPALSWIQNLLQSTLTPAVATTPVVPLEWPLPGRPTVVALTWLQTRPIFAKDEPTRFAADWPLPRIQTVPALTWIQTRPSFYVDNPTQFVQSWPNPQPSPAPALTWIFSVLGTTLVEETIPTRSGEWPLPRRAVVPALSWSQRRPHYYVDSPIRFAQSWPLPSPARPIALTWIQTRPIFAEDNRLIGTVETDLPAPTRVPALTWVQNLLESTLAPRSIIVRRTAMWRVGHRTPWRL